MDSRQSQSRLSLDNVTWTRARGSLGVMTLWFAVLGCGADTSSEALKSALNKGAQCQPDSSVADPVASTSEITNAEEASCRPGHGRHRHHHPKHCGAQCGDGVLQEGEQCDDGNANAGDGCSATCELDDDEATPGDDRPGFMLCAGESCSTDGRCCGDVSANKRTCIAEGEACMLGSSECDGPEDCADGEICWEARWALCSRPDNHDPRGAQRCHVDAHCAANQMCADGACVD